MIGGLLGALVFPIVGGVIGALVWRALVPAEDA